MNDSAPRRPVPWVSFCLATYRRPQLLEQTLRSITHQTWSDFEVIVSDNDPEGSGGPVVEALGDTRCHYYRNTENLGMIRNFNAALAQATGDYVVLITDDDPVYPHMLATLRELWAGQPGYGMYFGACEVLQGEQGIAQAYGGR